MSGNIDLAKFRKECIDAHNEFRAAHGTGELKLDHDISKKAQEWAEHLASIGTLKHTNSDLGENVAMTSRQATGWGITKMWYDEVADYSWVINGSSNGKPIGHFTQVVWKNSKRAGFGAAVSANGATYAVGNYDPAGNWKGQYGENVGEEKRKPVIPNTESSKPDERDNDSRSQGAPKPGTSVKTTTETFMENGERMKKTTTVTTTVTENPKGTFTTSTSTATKIERLDDGNEIADKVEEMGVDDEAVDDDSSDDERENVMPRPEKKVFRRDCLRQLNRLRRSNGIQSLRRTSVLQKAAQQHANRMLRNGRWSFLDDGKFAQAVVEKQPRPYDGEEIANMWFEEGRKSGGNGGTLWDKSREVGIGIASNKDGRTFIAAFFEPRGGAPNQFLGKVVE